MARNACRWCCLPRMKTALGRTLDADNGCSRKNCRRGAGHRPRAHQEWTGRNCGVGWPTTANWDRRTGFGVREPGRVAQFGDDGVVSGWRGRSMWIHPVTFKQTRPSIGEFRRPLVNGMAKWWSEHIYPVAIGRKTKAWVSDSEQGGRGGVQQLPSMAICTGLRLHWNSDDHAHNGGALNCRASMCGDFRREPGSTAEPQDANRERTAAWMGER